jgi:hypothetical protein
MKKSIKIQGTVALFLVGLGLSSSVFAGCSVIAPKPPITTCHCQCNNGAEPASMDPTFSNACKTFCVLQGIPSDPCQEVDVGGGTGGATASGGAGAAGKAGAGGSAGSCQIIDYAYCVNCTAFPMVCNEQWDIKDCTMSSAQAQANAIAKGSGTDCTAAICTGVDSGPACNGGTGGATAGTGGATAGTGGATAGTGGATAGTGGTAGTPSAGGTGGDTGSGDTGSGDTDSGDTDSGDDTGIIPPG